MIYGSFFNIAKRPAVSDDVVVCISVHFAYNVVSAVTLMALVKSKIVVKLLSVYQPANV
jgi:hypothetical protein